MYKFFTVFILLFGLTNAASSQTFDNFLGEWSGSGKLFGQDATFTMKWEKVLNGKFIKLNFQNNFTQNGRQSSMQAEAIYKQVSDSTYSGTWFDSRGVTFPVKAVFSKNTLTVNWGSPETETGSTVYQLNEKNELTVADFVNRNGARTAFGNAVYKKGG